MLFSDEGESGGLNDDDDDGDKSSEKEKTVTGEEDDLAAVQDSQFAEEEYGGRSTQGEQGEHMCFSSKFICHRKVMLFMPLISAVSSKVVDSY